MAQSTVLEIHTGRVASVRLGPNEDIVESLEQAGAQLGFRRALVRGGLGSLIDAAFEGTGGEPRRIQGPAVEILSMLGEISLEQGVEAAGTWGWWAIQPARSGPGVSSVA